MWQKATIDLAEGPDNSFPTVRWSAMAGVLVIVLSGCYAPLVSVGTPAALLPDTYRTPWRTSGEPMNYAALTLPPASEYLLSADDVLEVTIPDLYQGSPMTPMRIRVMPDGDVSLPLVGSVRVAGLSVSQAQAAITERYAKGYLVQPRVIVFLAEKAKVRVLVFGDVKNPGVYELVKYENDVGHAVAAAGGLTEQAADVIELHRRVPGGLESVSPLQQTPTEAEQLPDAPPDETEGVSWPNSTSQPAVPLRRLPALQTREMGPRRAATGDRAARAGQPARQSAVIPAAAHSPIQSRPDPKQVLRFPLRGLAPDAISASDVTLETGDAVVVPSRRHEVFFVVGKLNPINKVQFNASERDRELGTGLVLPRDREIDVITGVAMAGYIDPIDSPTTVTIQRTMPDGCPLLIRVDLIKARCNPKENVLIWPGDVVYLNPDGWWWWRRTFDRILPEIFTIPYSIAWGFNANN